MWQFLTTRKSEKMGPPWTLSIQVDSSTFQWALLLWGSSSACYGIRGWDQMGEATSGQEDWPSSSRPEERLRLTTPMQHRLRFARLMAHLPHFKGKYRLLNALTPREGKIRDTISGFPMYLELSDLIQRKVFMRTWERSELQLLPKLLKPGGVFLDVGANVGCYTAAAARCVGPAGIVHAFEPEPDIFAQLSAWASSANATQVICHQIAISDSEGALQMYVPPPSFRNHNASASRYCAQMQEITVKRTTLDYFITSTQLRHIDLMKMDIEGHELNALRGGSTHLRRGIVRYILCEFNPDASPGGAPGMQSLHDHFCSLGYKEILYRGGPPAYPTIGKGLPNRLFQFQGRGSAH